MKNYFYSEKFANIGVVWMAKTDSYIVRISLGGNLNSFMKNLPERNEWKFQKNIFKELVTKLQKFSFGECISFNEKIDISYGTDFQQSVWRCIKKIPWGKTISYSDLAKAICKPRAYRAVANACGKNPLPLIIPCHRVIASDGSIGGFSSGTPLKKKLLELEGIY